MTGILGTIVVDFPRIEDARNLRKKFLQFESNVLQTIEQITKITGGTLCERKWNSEDVSFQNRIHSAQSEVRERLRDNFDTAGAIKHLLDLVKFTNLYMQLPSKVTNTDELPLVSLPSMTLEFTKEMFRVFGAPFLGKSQVTFKLSCLTCQTFQNSSNNEADATSLIEALAHFRSQLRGELKAPVLDKKKLWSLVDEVRDKLPEYGVSVKDTPEGYIIEKINK